MKYKYMGNTEMIVDGKTVKRKGDIIETDKKIEHHSFIKVNDENIKVQIFNYGGNL